MSSYLATNELRGDGAEWGSVVRMLGYPGDLSGAVSDAIPI